MPGKGQAVLFSKNLPHTLGALIAVGHGIADALAAGIQQQKTHSPGVNTNSGCRVHPCPQQYRKSALKPANTTANSILRTGFPVILMEFQQNICYFCLYLSCAASRILKISAKFVRFQ